MSGMKVCAVFRLSRDNIIKCHSDPLETLSSRHLRNLI